MTLYHGSKVADIRSLEPRSKLHGSPEEKVVYLSGSIPYALVYIWDSEKTGYSGKWVTCALKSGVVHYEEMFPDQLKAFYEGVSGYLYFVEQTSEMERMPESHEDMFYSKKPVPVGEAVFVEDVYRELLRYEAEGSLVVHRFTEAAEEEQERRIQHMVTGIERDGLLDSDSEKARFVRKYFKQAWELAESH